MASHTLCKPCFGKNVSQIGCNFRKGSEFSHVIPSKNRAHIFCAASAEPAETFTNERKQARERVLAEKPFTISEIEATSQVEYNTAKIISSKEVASGVKLLTVEAEISRELVKLDAAFILPGQKVNIRLPSGDVVVVTPSSEPFPEESNHSVLLKARGDIPAGSTKLAQYGLSVKYPLDLHVSQAAAPALYSSEVGSEVEIGPFFGAPNYRPILFISRFTTMLIFVSGDGVAAARSLIRAKDVGSLYLNMREEARLYYSAPSPSELAYQDEWSEWEKKVQMKPTVQSKNGEEWNGFVGSISELFDEDDLEYDPETTAAVILGSKAENEAVFALLKEAEIPERAIVRVDL